MALEDIILLDQNITLAINSLNSPLTDRIWLFFSNTQVWFPMYAIIAGCCFWRLGWKRGIAATVALALMVLCCDQTANLFKDGVQRFRPCHTEYMIENGLHMLSSGSLYGFFSGHAANSFGFAWSSLLLFRMDKRLKYRGYAAWIFSWAILVSFSRDALRRGYSRRSRGRKHNRLSHCSPGQVCLQTVDCCVTNPQEP